MTGTELLGLLIVIFVIWMVLKMMRVAIKMIFFIVALVVIAGVVYWLMQT